MLTRSADYHEKSSILADLSGFDKLIKQANEELFETIVGSVRGLRQLTESDDERIRLDAIKYHTKLCGMDVDRSVTDSKQEVVISVEQRNKILELANDDSQ